MKNSARECGVKWRLHLGSSRGVESVSGYFRRRRTIRMSGGLGMNSPPLEGQQAEEMLTNRISPNLLKKNVSMTV